MPRSIHDNFVLRYSVDAERATIKISTEFRDQGQPYERTDVHFEGVIAYSLRDGLDGCLFDIEEDTLDRILEEHADEFRWGLRYGWPGSWNKGPEAVRKHVATSGAHVWRIQGQNVFDGFVIARRMSLHAAEQADGD